MSATQETRANRFLRTALFALERANNTSSRFRAPRWGRAPGRGRNSSISKSCINLVLTRAGQ